MATTSPQSSLAALDASIERLYEAFSNYRRPQGQTYSPHTSITDDDVRAIRERPLRSLNGTDLAKYAMKALTTWGDEDEFRYYLPRLFDLLVRQRGWIDEATLFLKLEDGKWRTWPKAEQEAIEVFINALWDALLSGAVQTPLLNYVALGTAYAGIPLRRFVDRWKTTRSPAAAIQLANVITLARRDLLKDGSLGRRWPEEARAALNDLIHAPEARGQIEEAFLAAQDKEQEHVLSGALGVLEVLPPQS